MVYNGHVGWVVAMPPTRNLGSSRGGDGALRVKKGAPQAGAQGGWSAHGDMRTGQLTR